jgi:hypothetical protein
MNSSILLNIESLFKTITDILAAGIAITGFSLLLFAIKFNIRERVVRSFMLILSSVVIVFTAEAFSGTSSLAWQIDLLMRFQWVGIVILPAAYLHLSDALLETTGRPSKWKRRWAVRFAYVVSICFLILIPTNLLVNKIVMTSGPAPHLQPTIWTTLFSIYYLVTMVLTWINFFRSYRRAATVTSKRRMAYLLVGALAPALGSYPFLLYGSQLVVNHPLAFWIVASVSDVFVGLLLVFMAYSVSFFGVSWPDRVIKSRLFRWLLRGPVTAILALGLTTIVRRAGEGFGLLYTGWVPLTMVGTVLLMEYLITIIGPSAQRWLFYSNDQEDLELLQMVEDRLLTRSDLRQFLEMVLAAVCDHLQAKGAYIVALDSNQLELVVKIGLVHDSNLEPAGELFQFSKNENAHEGFSRLGQEYVLGLRDGRFSEEKELLGLLVVNGNIDDALIKDQQLAIDVLVSRAGLALRDRLSQEQIFQSLESLTPQVEMIQQLRAAGRYNRNGILTGDYELVHQNMSNWVKDALDHYWGGPKLTDSPLIQLQIVQNGLPAHEGNPSNALRTVLKSSIDRLKPEGERKYVSEWMLYNLLAMKYLEGKKVKEIARKLAISEADLYRKQRIAIQNAAKIILDMEDQITGLKK